MRCGEKSIFLGDRKTNATFPLSHVLENQKWECGVSFSILLLYQAITQTNAGLLAIGPIGTNFSEILIEVRENAFENVIRRSKSFCRALNKN